MVDTKKSIILPGIFGNALEWYDFTTYAFFVPIISQLFFPTKTPLLSLIITFGVFATSFLIRPVGGVLFGYIGDKFGRKKALIISIIIMTIPTFLFGVLPTYATIGLAAPILLTLLRLIQGIAVSGELSTAISFLVEHASKNRRGFMGSLALFSAFCGIAISSAVSTLVTESMTQEQLLMWGWRIPFLMAAVLGIIGLILRLRTIETKHYRAAHERHESKTYFLLKHLIQHHYKELLISIFLTCVMGVGNYFIIAYFVTFLNREMGLPLREAMMTNLIGLIVFGLLIPLFGFLSDLLGRKRILLIGILGTMIISYPVFLLLAQGNIHSALIGQILFVVFLAAINGTIPTILAEQFPTHVRNSGLGIGYNVSLGLFGGTAPLIALTLVQVTSNKLTPAFYLILAGVVSMLTLAFIKETYKKTLK